jgi:hypothetical protein
MNKGIRYTKAFFVVSILLVAAYDTVVLLTWGTDATISRVIGVQASFDSPALPFGAGVIMGHLFWPQPRANRNKKPT